MIGQRCSSYYGANMTKKVETEAPAGVYELLAEFRSKLGTDKETGGRVREAELYAAAVAGEALVAVRPFQADGGRYEPGDEIFLSPQSKILGPTWVTTAGRWQSNQAARERERRYRDEIGPAEALAARLVREEAAAHRESEAAQLAAVNAKIAAAKARDRREEAENTLFLLLSGDAGV